MSPPRFFELIRHCRSDESIAAFFCKFIGFVYQGFQFSRLLSLAGDGIDILQRPRRFVAKELTVEIDLIAHFPDCRIVQDIFDVLGVLFVQLTLVAFYPPRLGPFTQLVR